MMPRLSWANAAWLIAYLCTIFFIVGLVLYARSWTIAELSTPEGQANWNAFRREEARMMAAGGPVARRAPKSPEPPALVLMRDHFPVVMSAALVFGSALFGFFTIALRGLWSSAGHRQASSDASP